MAETGSIRFDKTVDHLIPAREGVMRVLKQLGCTIGEIGLDLLQKCLDPDPRTRITASQALLHPFFYFIPDQILNSTFNNPIRNYIAQLNCLEFQLLPNPNYLTIQKDINTAMRSILVD